VFGVEAGDGEGLAGVGGDGARTDLFGLGYKRRVPDRSGRARAMASRMGVIRKSGSDGEHARHEGAGHTRGAARCG
jgi:hypothetical protein